MKKVITLLFVFCTLLSFAQEEALDTIYYDKDWKGCSKAFATYFRVITVPTEANPTKRLRDYYVTGELQGESNYIMIDKQDDKNTIFDGEVIAYYKNGNIHYKSKWQDSHQVGEFFEYYENGKVKRHYICNDFGKIDGDYCFFDENGDLTSIIEYHNGNRNSYFTAYNKMGSMGQYDLQTNKLIKEAVPLSALKTKIVKGDTYYYYDDKNGIYLSVFIDAIKHYGKYYRIGISIFNNTNSSFVFDPTQITAKGRFYKRPKKNEDFNENDFYSLDQEANYIYTEKVKSKDIKVWSFADYSKKVHRRQIWDEALVAIGQGLAASGAGYSTATSTSTTYGSAYGYGSGYGSAYGSGGYAYGSYNSSAYVSGTATTTTTTTYYDATAAAIAQERAAYNISTYSASLEYDTQAINDNYFQITTLNSQTEAGGYILLNKDKPQIIDLTIPINGVAYRFHLSEIPK